MVSVTREPVIKSKGVCDSDSIRGCVTVKSCLRKCNPIIHRRMLVKATVGVDSSSDLLSKGKVVAGQKGCCCLVTMSAFTCSLGRKECSKE